MWGTKYAELKILTFIIWQDSLEVNPSVLIGSFFVGNFAYGPFLWKRSYAVYLFIYLFIYLFYFIFFIIIIIIFFFFGGGGGLSKAGKFKLRKEHV